ncbi:MAG TPA: phosphoribosyltransferase family protein [Verrucomicrobiae bacterium]|nr:phosphoribosyltransferase family protein [Verrucomicrobiae bacterium]
MFETFISGFAPHRCYNCRKIGSLLCLSCEENIDRYVKNDCILCAKPAANGICAACANGTITQIIVVSERKGSIKQLLNGYKFHRQRAAGIHCARLLARTLPQLPTNSYIVPIPTAARHIRQRGYDHTLLIAKQLGGLLNTSVTPLLQRHHDKTQVGASKAERLVQAANAFSTTATLDPKAHYILIDDIITTGATVRAAARVLAQAGARTITIAAVAHQNLDESPDLW